jgi:hypothetical protein
MFIAYFSKLPRQAPQRSHCVKKKILRMVRLRFRVSSGVRHRQQLRLSITRQKAHSTQTPARKAATGHAA